VARVAQLRVPDFSSAAFLAASSRARLILEAFELQCMGHRIAKKHNVISRQRCGTVIDVATAERTTSQRVERRSGAAYPLPILPRLLRVVQMKKAEAPVATGLVLWHTCCPRDAQLHVATHGMRRRVGRCRVWRSSAPTLAARQHADMGTRLASSPLLKAARQSHQHASSTARMSEIVMPKTRPDYQGYLTKRSA
jgi:hypothetical protein